MPPIFRKIIGPLAVKIFFHRYWRLKRPATLGAQGIILNAENDVLLIRHTYRPGWHFPGGGVEFSEKFEDALKREVLEETGVIITGPPTFHGIFANFKTFPSDHIAVFIIKDWEQPSVPAKSMEIAEQGFFSYDQLPEDTTEGTRNRLTEIFENEPLQTDWR